jgi:hypothetical protein
MYSTVTVTITVEAHSITNQKVNQNGKMGGKLLGPGTNEISITYITYLHSYDTVNLYIYYWTYFTWWLDKQENLQKLTKF